MEHVQPHLRIIGNCLSGLHPCSGLERWLTSFETSNAAARASAAPSEMQLVIGSMLAQLGCCKFIFSMIVGSGIDLTEIPRIQHSMDRFGARFLNRVYTAAEQAYCLRKRNAAESFAARFAAKEAGAKALGTGISHGVSWLEIEVVR